MRCPGCKAELLLHHIQGVVEIVHVHVVSGRELPPNSDAAAQAAAGCVDSGLRTWEVASRNSCSQVRGIVTPGPECLYLYFVFLLRDSS